MSPPLSHRAGQAQPAKAQPSGPTLAGSWTGAVTVQIGDSTINAPVMYNFVGSGAATSGMAMVPGQGTGPISNVVRNGANVKFRVTGKQGEPGKEVLRLLEHDGTIGSDGVMSGQVTMDGKLVAKFRIAPRK
jgi:hypothetical protein